MPPRAALVLFSKFPTPGEVKTRMVPPLAPEQAAELYRAMLADALDLARRAPHADRFVAYWPPDRGAEFRAPAGKDFQLLAQRGANLAERMAAAFGDLFEQGYARVIAVGGDGPLLPPERFAEALAALEENDLYVTPSRDGGYALLALRRPAPELFLGVPMGTSGVLAATLSAARRLGLSVASPLPPAAADLDTVDDLRVFLRTAGDAAPRTRAAAGRLLGGGEA